MQNVCRGVKKRRCYIDGKRFCLRLLKTTQHLLHLTLDNIELMTFMLYAFLLGYQETHCSLQQKTYA